MGVCACDKICLKLIYERKRERKTTNIQRVNSCKAHQLTVEQKTIDQNILHKILHATLAREGFHAQKDNLLMEWRIFFIRINYVGNQARTRSVNVHNFMYIAYILFILKSKDFSICGFNHLFKHRMTN